MKKHLFWMLFTFMMFGTSAQVDIQNAGKQKKNTIRWNITPLILNTNNITFGYERLVNKNQSFSINSGFLLFPRFLKENGTYVSAIKPGNRIGFTISGDYRFYLGKRNKFPAPNGVYIGPYFSHYQYAFENIYEINGLDYLESSIAINTKFAMTSLGFELGYQFVFYNMFTLDLILVGPSLSYYNARVIIDGDLEIDEESEAYQYIKEQIQEKYPWVDTFVDLGAINTGGKLKNLGLGFRYVIQIGFHF